MIPTPNPIDFHYDMKPESPGKNPQLLEMPGPGLLCVCADRKSFNLQGKAAFGVEGPRNDVACRELNNRPQRSKAHNTTEARSFQS